MSFLSDWMPFTPNIDEESCSPENYIKEELKEDGVEDDYLEIKEENCECKTDGTDIDIKHECSFYENLEGERNETGACNSKYAYNYSLSAVPFLAEDCRNSCLSDGLQSTHEDYDNEVMNEILDMNGKYCVCEM